MLAARSMRAPHHRSISKVRSSATRVLWQFPLKVSCLRFAKQCLWAAAIFGQREPWDLVQLGRGFAETLTSRCFEACCSYQSQQGQSWQKHDWMQQIDSLVVELPLGPAKRKNPTKCCFNATRASPWGWEGQGTYVVTFWFSRPRKFKNNHANSIWCIWMHMDEWFSRGFDEPYCRFGMDPWKRLPWLLYCWQISFMHLSHRGACQLRVGVPFLINVLW